MILVTGAAGFIGSRFVEHCNRLSEPVLSIDRAQYFKDRKELLGINFGTIIDRDEWILKIQNKKTSPDYPNMSQLKAIVHLGACTDTAEMDVAYLKRVNIEYSQALYNFATEREIPFIYASSAATYGAGEKGYDDDESRISELRPQNPYGQSKHQFDLWLLKTEPSYHPPAWAGFKFFNVYGFGERHKETMASVVLKAYDQISKTGSLKLFKSHRTDIKDGEQKRDFVFVEDVISVLWSALGFALESKMKRGIFNLGTGQARSFLDLAKGVFHTMGMPPKIEFIPTPEVIRSSYQYFTEASMSRLKSAGFSKPFASLEEGIQKTLTRLKHFEKANC